MRIAIVCRNREEFNNSVDTMIARGQLDSESIVERAEESLFLKGGNLIKMVTIGRIEGVLYDLYIPETNFPTIVDALSFKESVREEKIWL